MRKFMQITQDACNYVKNSPFEDTVIVIFEREYKGWCGTQKVRSVAPAERTKVINPEKYVEKTIENCNFPVLIDGNLVQNWEKMKIDLVGWSAFKRLSLIQNSP